MIGILGSIMLGGLAVGVCVIVAFAILLFIQVLKNM